MPFTYPRTVRFPDTDAAGVVYFASVLSICHEAYEASLETTGINLKEFFRNPELAIPIAHASIDFFRPLYCGDRLLVHLTPRVLLESEFEVSYEIYLAAKSDRSVSRAQTRHVCIHPPSRSRLAIPADLVQWLQKINPA